MNAKIFGAENATAVDQEIQREILRQLGLLPPDVARDIMIFNNHLFGLRTDMRAIAVGQMDELSDDEKAGILEADLKLWEDTLALGRSIVARLHCWRLKQPETSSFTISSSKMPQLPLVLHSVTLQICL